MVNQEQYFDLPDIYSKEHLGNKLRSQISDLTKQADADCLCFIVIFATPSLGRPAMLCDLCSTCSEVDGMSHLHSLVLD